VPTGALSRKFRQTRYENIPAAGKVNVTLLETMKSKLILGLALVLSGVLFGCSTSEQPSANSKPPPPDLYLHLIASFNYPEPPRLIVSSPIHRSSDFDILMDDHQHLKGHIEPRNGKFFVHFQGRLCSGINVFDGEVELEKREEPWPQPYDEKAPFVCQPHFILSSNSNPKPFLKRQADAEKNSGSLETRSLAGAEQYFKQYLATCDTDEIRCLWFLQDNPHIGMVMTVNLRNYTVYTVRDVYNWAEQSSETRKLSHPQVVTLKQIVNGLPPSGKNAGFDRSVFVSIRKGSQTEVFQYDRRHAPTVIQRIYDIGGGYFYSGKAN
jgi:hypothetical protein